MEPSPSETNSVSATREFPTVSGDPKFHYRVRKSPPLVPILNQINPVYIYPSYFSNIHFNIILQKLKTELNSVAFSPQANYTDRATAACRRS
jgi:hypothetical protein